MQYMSPLQRQGRRWGGIALRAKLVRHQQQTMPEQGINEQERRIAGQEREVADLPALEAQSTEHAREITALRALVAQTMSRTAGG